MARAYRMTSARRAAIKKAQRISAQKRRGKRRKRIATGVAAAGVVGVTLYAANKYRKRGSGGGRPMNAVSATMDTQKVSDSREVDLFRTTVVEATRYNKKGMREKINFSTVGRADVRYKAEPPPHYKRAQKAKKLNRHSYGKGKVRVDSQGIAVKVLRNRMSATDSFHDDRRLNYLPSTRKVKYLELDRPRLVSQGKLKPLKKGNK